MLRSKTLARGADTTLDVWRSIAHVRQMRPWPSADTAALHRRGLATLRQVGAPGLQGSILRPVGRVPSRGGPRWAVAGRVMWCVVLLCLAGCSKPATPPRPADSPPAKASAPATGPAWFEEISTRAGLTFQHASGHEAGRFWLPEIVTGGVGLLDFDRDGRLDIFCVSGGSLTPGATNRPGHRLYHNLGDWRFAEVTGRVGLAAPSGYGMGAACGDYNGDGWTDIYVTNLGTNILYRNNGNGTFTDVTAAAGAAGGPWGISAAFVDYDRDGQLDLVVANYLHWTVPGETPCFSKGGLPDYCSPLNYHAPAHTKLFRNLGQDRFADVTRAAGLDQALGNGMGVGCADFNHDGWPDIFVANDAMPNHLWINQRNGTFKDEALIRGCAVNANGVAEAGMGVAVVDLLQRGSLDLFVTHLEREGNRLWINSNGTLSDTVRPKGPGQPSLPFTGFGVVFADFDNDGILDLHVANGKVKHGRQTFDPKDPYAEPNTLLRGLGQGDFEAVLPLGGTAHPLIASGRGVAAGDLDNDGGLDLVVINRDGPAHLLRNQAANGSRWVGFRVLNRHGTEAIGAMVKLTAGGKVQWRQINPNQSYASSNDPRAHFGLGTSDSAQEILIQWPDGQREAFGPFQGGQYHEVVEGKGAAR